MKYKDLIDKLLPFADEEINLTANHEEKYHSIYGDDPEYGNRKKSVDTVSFYKNDDEGNRILAIEQTYDTETLKNIGEAKIICP